MRQNIFHWKSVMALLLVVLLGGAWMGCSTTVKERNRVNPYQGQRARQREKGRGWVGIILTMSVSQMN